MFQPATPDRPKDINTPNDLLEADDERFQTGAILLGASIIWYLTRIERREKAEAKGLFII